MEKAQEVELGHTPDRSNGGLLRKQAHDLIPQAWAGEPVDEIGRSCFLEQGQRVFLDTEAEPLLKADGSKHTGRVVHEAAGVEDADDLVFEIAQAAIEIHELAEAAHVQADGQRVDGEVPAVEVVLDRTRFDRGQGGRVNVGFAPGGGHVQLETIREDDEGRGEFLEDLQAGSVTVGQAPRESHRVALHGDVHVQVRLPQQEVTDQAADKISRCIHGVSQRAYLSEPVEDFRRQATTCQDAQVVMVLKGDRLHCHRIVTGQGKGAKKDDD